MDLLTSPDPSNASLPRQRAQDNTQEIDQYIRHGSRFRDISQRRGGEPVDNGAKESFSRPVDARNLAARPSPTPRPPSKPHPQETGAPLDARSLGARNPQFTIGRQPQSNGAVDARNFAAQPSSIPRPPPSARRPQGTGAPLDARNMGASKPQFTMGIQPQQSSGTVDARSYGASKSSTSDSPNIQPRNFVRRAVINDSTERTPNSNRTRTPRDASSRRPNRNGPAPRSRSARSGENAMSGFGRDASPEAIDAESRLLEMAQNKKKQPKAEPYTPAPLTAESLSGYGPALPIEGFGMDEAVEGWVGRIETRGLGRQRDVELMVDKWKRGDFVDFRGDDEIKKRVLEGVENGLGEMGEEEQEKVAETLRETFGSAVGRKAFKGEYAFEGRQGKSVLDAVMRQTVRNASFRSRDGETLAAKVRSLLPAETAGGGQKAARA